MGCCSKEENHPIELRENVAPHEHLSLPKYGKRRKYNPSFTGPVYNRSCTDVICCILFLLLLIAMIGVGAIAFLFGNPKLLLYPTDSEGNTCGVGRLEDKKNLFFFDLYQCFPKHITELHKIKSCPTTQVCVRKCPTKNTMASKAAKKSDLFCTYATQEYLTNASVTAKELVRSGYCANYTLESEAIFHRCVPTIASGKLREWLKKEANITVNRHQLTLDGVKNGTVALEMLSGLKNLGRKVIEDIERTWQWILAGFGIALVASFLYILLMQWIADIVVWLTTYGVLTLSGYGIYYTYKEYRQLAAEADDESDIDFRAMDLSSYANQKETWLVLCIILSTVAFIWLLLLLALRKRIGIAIQLIKEGSKAISALLSTLFFPMIPWLFQLLLLGWFLVVMAFLATSNKPEFRQVLSNGTILQNLCNKVDAIAHHVTGSRDTLCMFSRYTSDRTVFYLQIFNIFACFWVMNFITSFGQCVLAGTFASWYWAWDKRFDVQAFPLLSSFGRTMRYHMGSLAFGSLVIALVQVARETLEYIEFKLRNNRGGEQGAVTRFFLKCMSCCFWCLEKFMKFLNKNAYVEIAVHGKNFCVSARNAFFLLMRNILRVAVLDKVTDFLLLLGKVMITSGMGFGAYRFFRDNEELHYYQSPLGIVIVATWVVASAFFGVYEMAINTIFICFLEDSEKHDGSRDKPYYMSKKLQKILHKKNESSDGE